MSSTTQVTDFSDLYTDLINRARESTSNAAIVVLAKRYINTALQDMHTSTNFYWAERRATLITHGPYTTGTVTIDVSTSRTAVTGASTAWATATDFGWNNARAGGKIKFSGLNEIYEVASVGSDTALTLNTQYTGDDLSGDTYEYFEDEYALASDFNRFIDLRFFNLDYPIHLVGRSEFRRAVVRNDYRQKPRVATLIEKAFSWGSSTTPQPRVVLYPVPDDEYSIPYTYSTKNLAVTSAGVEQVSLSSDTDEPIVPLRYRQAIVFKALKYWYQDYKDDPVRAQMADADYAGIMARVMGDTHIGQDRPRFIATQKGRTPILGRYDVGGRFDTLRDRWGR